MIMLALFNRQEKKVPAIGSLKCPRLIIQITKIAFFKFLRKQLNEATSEAK